MARSGIGYVVVRNDLQVGISEDRNAVIRETLRRSPGIELVASFGPKVGGSGVAVVEGSRSFSRGGWSSKAPAVEIFAVRRSAALTSGLTTVAGSAADVLGLHSLGVVSGDTILASDQEGAPMGRYVLTDGLREQEAAFGAVDRVRSATKLPGEQWSLDRPVHDYLTGDQTPWLTKATLGEGVTLRASSSRSQATALRSRRTDSSPWAAFDASPLTAWRADGSRGWIEIGFGRDRTVGDVTLRGGLPSGQVQAVTVVSDGDSQQVTLPGNDPVTVPVGTASSIRITVSRAGREAQLADVDLSAVSIDRTLELPDAPDGWGDPDEVVLGMGTVRRPGCVEFDRAVRCRGGQEDLSEDAGGISREFSLDDHREWKVRTTMRAVASDGLERLAQRGRSVHVSTSSAVTDDPGGSSVQLIDGSRNTAWTADAEDTDPTIRVRWNDQVTVSELELTTPVSQPASTVARVIVRSGDVRLTAPVENGRAVLPEPVTTNELAVSLVSAEDARDYRSDGTWSTLPVGLAEFDVDAAIPRLDPRMAVGLACESESPLRINGDSVPVRGSTSLAALLRGESVELVACDDVRTNTGRQRVDFVPTSLLVPESVRMTDTDATVVAGGQSLDVRRWNANRAWLDADGASPAVVNGWQQGFWTTGKAAPTFSAESSYTAVLRFGAVAAGLLVLVALTLRRRRRLIPSREWAPRFTVGGLLVLGTMTFAGIGGGAAVLAGFVAACLPRPWVPAVVAGVAMSGSLAVAVLDGEIVSGGLAQLLAAVALGAVARSAFTRR